MIKVFKYISYFNNLFCRLLTIIAGIILGFIALILFYSVLMRYAFNSPVTWSEDAAKILMVWMVLVGAPPSLRGGSHIAIEVMLDKMPSVISKIFRIVSIVLIVFVAWVFLNYGWSFSMKGMRRIVPSMEWLKFGFAYLALPLGYGFLIPICMEQILRILFGNYSDYREKKELK